jgi:DNA-binding Lrp family transcriptional regulator
METQIVRIVAARGRADAASVARSMGVSAEYLAPRIRRLAEGGYLRDVGSGIYAVEQQGMKVLFPYAGRKRGPREPVANYP